MKTTSSRAPKQQETWPYKVTYGSVTVPVYKRTTPSGYENFMVADDSTGQRRFLSFKIKSEALAQADRLARNKAGLATMVQNITSAQAIEYFNALGRLKPYHVTVDAATSTVADCLKDAGSLEVIREAIRFYRQRHREVTDKRVDEVVTELLKVKKARGASARYLKDLSSRLTAFAGSFQMNIGGVTTPQIQAWLDQLKLSAQSVRNFRTVLNLFFSFAIARGYAVDNPVAGVERVKVNGGEIEIYSPTELQRLLTVASQEFLPCIAIGAFAGLRSAEIERLEWQDIRLAEKLIVVGKSKAKTASRRIVPISDNLAAWLASYTEKTGKVWAGTSIAFYKAEQKTAADTEIKPDNGQGLKPQKAVKWKANGLRHSAASYMFALSNDAGRVAGYLGNSAAVVHRHYRELVTPTAAKAWFSIMPERAVNVLPMAPTAIATAN